MAAIKLMEIKSVDTTYGTDVRCVYASHMLNEGFAEFHETYDPAVFFELAKAYLVEIDDTIVGFTNALVQRTVD